MRRPGICRRLVAHRKQLHMVAGRKAAHQPERPQGSNLCAKKDAADDGRHGSDSRRPVSHRRGIASSEKQR